MSPDSLSSYVGMSEPVQMRSPDSPSPDVGRG